MVRFGTTFYEDAVNHRPQGMADSGRPPLEQYTVVGELMGAHVDLAPEIRADIVAFANGYHVYKSWTEGRITCRSIQAAREKVIEYCNDWLRTMRRD